jgi:LmbE family N-acetylglucosaminyl deacetylase
MTARSLGFYMRKLFFLAALLVSVTLAPRSPGQFPPPPGTGPGLPETIEAIESAGVTTRILYITAHPDDESAAVLTYLARGLHAEVALLSLTRGEGGQNDLGPEQAPQLGLIRTQELLAATRGYGVKLFFTRAPDFGFSKTPEETQKIWGDQVLHDMVEVIRTFRPNVVLNNWAGVHSGHGHHQASGVLTPKAVQLAADKSYAPEADCAVCQREPWGGAANPVVILNYDRGSNSKGNYVLPLDDVSPLWAKTWREIGLDAFANHRTQGVTVFLGSPFLRRPMGLVRDDGKPLDPVILAKPLRDFASTLTQEGCAPGEALSSALSLTEEQLKKAKNNALILHWQEAASEVAQAAQAIQGVNPPDSSAVHCSDPEANFEFAQIKSKVDHALALTAAVEVIGTADRSNVPPGDDFKISASVRCRTGLDCSLGELHLNLAEQMKETKRDKDAVGRQSITVDVQSLPGKTDVWDQGLLPEPRPLASLAQDVTVSGYRFAVTEPVTYIEATSTHVVRVPLRIVPPITISVEPKQIIEFQGKKSDCCELQLRLHSYSTKPLKARIGVDIKDQALWKLDDSPSADFAGLGDRYVQVRVSPTRHLALGNYPLHVYAQIDGEKLGTSIEPLPSLPTQVWSEPSQCIVRAFDIKVPQNLRVGYITAENEPVPEALRQLGIQVEMLDAPALAFSNLSRFDAIVAGVRAYELRSDLAGANQRLLNYVSNGGTLVVQYNRDFAWSRGSYAPYPAKIENPSPQGILPRITDETSPVKFLQPNDPLLNRPNKITADDFNGWVQERGLYFWTTFDPKYTAPLGMSDPGEPELNGSLVYTHYGKGTYIYTGIAFFRQLPEGVPGAYRLFVNLLSASRAVR